jgi:HPt (histidine-containing phosphotransfer) domain-containing protein
VTHPDASGGPLADVLDTKVFNDLHHAMISRPDALAGVYRTFFGHSHKLIDTLRDQESAAREHTLHALKGSAAMLGARRLAAVAARLQHENLQSPALLAQAIETLEMELESFRRAIAARLTLEPPHLVSVR